MDWRIIDFLNKIFAKYQFTMNFALGLGLGGLATCLPDSDSKIVPVLGLGLVKAGLGLEKN